MQWQIDETTHVRYLKQGTGPLVVLLHGMGGLAEIFTAQMTALSQAGYTALSLDLPGFGGTNVVDATKCSIQAVIDQTQMIIEHFAGKQAVTLVGHSMGAAVAYGLLATPLNIASVVAIDQSPKMLADATWKYGFKDWTTTNFPAKILAPSLGKATVHPLAPVVWQAYHPARQTYDHFDLARSTKLLRTHAKADWRAVLKQTATPVLFVTSPQSPYFDERFATSLVPTNSQLHHVSIADCGHLIMAEQPAKFNAALLNWLNQQG